MFLGLLSYRAVNLAFLLLQVILAVCPCSTSSGRFSNRVDAKASAGIFRDDFVHPGSLFYLT